MKTEDKVMGAMALIFCITIATVALTWNPAGYPVGGTTSWDVVTTNADKTNVCVVSREDLSDYLKNRESGGYLIRSIAPADFLCLRFVIVEEVNE